MQMASCMAGEVATTFTGLSAGEQQKIDVAPRSLIAGDKVCQKTGGVSYATCDIEDNSKNYILITGGSNPRCLRARQ